MRREAVMDGDYRYSLIREWDESNLKRVVFVLLNPSTADDEVMTKLRRYVLNLRKDLIILPNMLNT